MTLQEVEEMTKKISDCLEMHASLNDKLGVELCLRLEQMAWDTYRLSNEIKELRETMF